MAMIGGIEEPRFDEVGRMPPGDVATTDVVTDVGWTRMPEFHAVLDAAAGSIPAEGSAPDDLLLAASGPTPTSTGRRAADDGPDLGELSLDLTQIALDVIGIFEPTPFADITNTLISGARGDVWGAVLSGAGVFPYVGDLAKAGKLGRYAETVVDAVELAGRSPAARAALEPALRRIDDVLQAIPEGALDDLPDALREPLQRMKGQLDEFFGRAGDDAAQAAARNAPIQRLDAPDRADLDPQRIDDLSFNHEQGRPDIREGIGGARAEAALDTQFRASDVEGVDFFDGDAAVSLKGPLLRQTGEAITITDRMVDGLAKSVIKDAKLNTASDVIVVDAMGLSPAQRERLVQAITDGLADLGGNHKPIRILE